jgi:hypothetical protein
MYIFFSFSIHNTKFMSWCRASEASKNRGLPTPGLDNNAQQPMSRLHLTAYITAAVNTLINSENAQFTACLYKYRSMTNGVCAAGRYSTVPGQQTVLSGTQLKHYLMILRHNDVSVEQ